MFPRVMGHPSSTGSETKKYRSYLLAAQILFQAFLGTVDAPKRFGTSFCQAEGSVAQSSWPESWHTGLLERHRESA